MYAVTAVAATRVSFRFVTSSVALECVCLLHVVSVCFHLLHFNQVVTVAAASDQEGCRFAKSKSKKGFL